MAELFEYLQYPWIIRAMIASVMVGISCGLLGVFIVLRNMALIGDALSHAILPGIVLAFLIFGTYHLSGFFIGAVFAGLVAAVAITWIQQNLPTKNDAAIGIIFTVMFALGVIGISILSRREGVHLDLNDFLFGNVLGVSTEDLYLNFLIVLVVIASMVFFYRYFYLSSFQESFAKALGINTSLIHYYLMLMLSFTVVASLQTVGVILVVAMLVSPASTAILWSDNLRKILILSAIIGMLSAILGLTAAVFFEIPPGPTMAVVAFIFYLVSSLFAPEKGVLANYLKQSKYKKRVIREDLIKYLCKNAHKGALSAETISDDIGLPANGTQRFLRKMKRDGDLKNPEPGQWICTSSGLKKGIQLVRAHRLWESWLVANTGLNEDQIHNDAELYEHLLDRETIDYIDASLGFPDRDPHGEHIPKIYDQKKVPMLELKAGDLFLINGEDDWQIELEDQCGIGLINRVLKVISTEGDRLKFSRAKSKEGYRCTIEPHFKITRLRPIEDPVLK